MSSRSRIVKAATQTKTGVSSPWVDPPCAPCDSAPSEVPNAPSKFIHLERCLTSGSLSSSSRRPRRDSAWTTMYKKRVSVSPHLSPATDPLGLTNPMRTNQRDPEGAYIAPIYPSMVPVAHPPLESTEFVSPRVSRANARRGQDELQTPLMSAASTEPTLLIIPAAEYVAYHLIPIQSVLPPHQTQSDQAPVNAIDAQMLS